MKPLDYAMKINAGAICNCSEHPERLCKRHALFLEIITEAMATARASAFTEAAKAICPLCKEGFYVTDSPHGWIHPHDGISADGKGLSRWHTCYASSVRTLASQAEEK